MRVLTKPKNPRFRYVQSKYAKVTLALLLCMGFFIAPTTATHAANTNYHIAPPAVEAEITGSLLRIQAMAGFYAVEAVYINERRFNYRVDSALIIDISQYIVSGDTISVNAVDFAGNQSNTVLLTPPAPAQPPQPNNLTPDGQGEIIDRASHQDGIEFLTINSATGNVFHLIIDHTRSSNNVYFLNPVTEWDLINLAEAASIPAPPQYAATPTPAPTPTPAEPSPTPAPEPEPPPKSGGRSGTFIFLLIGGAAAFGVIYYLKIYKPKKEKEMYESDGNEEFDENDDGFEDLGYTDYEEEPEDD